MDTAITRAEHDEFRRTMETENQRLIDENNRQNKRLELVEESVRQISDLTISVKEMAVNMGNMLKELEKQGERLEKLEQEPAEAHKQIKMAMVTAAISTIMGAVIGALIMIV